MAFWQILGNFAFSESGETVHKISDSLSISTEGTSYTTMGLTTVGSDGSVFIQQGVFSYYLINGLKGAADLNRDRYITMGELFLYTKNETSRKSNNKQVPVVYGKNLDLIPLARLKN